MNDKEDYQRNPSFYSGEVPPVAQGTVYTAGTPYPQYQQQQQQQYAPYSPPYQQYSGLEGAYPSQQRPPYVAVPLVAQPAHCRYYDDLHDERLGCARFGCMLSWIPLIGLITFLLNVSAPMGSRRRRLAWTSLFVAAFVCFTNLGVGFVLYFTIYATAATSTNQ